MTAFVLPKSVFRVKFEWIKYKTKRKWSDFLALGESSWGLTKRVLKEMNRVFDYSLLNWNKCFHVGVKNIPVWVVSAEELDFPRRKPLPFLHHLGTTTDLNRKEFKDPYFEVLTKKIQDKKIVYCSLGTFKCHTHNKQGFEFFAKSS
ncbi:MAG: hypothetical protein U5L45_15060 [Saprospiraceae bacterium]|nr:hypothetical protein [Saprospiraceae bacterium]